MMPVALAFLIGLAPIASLVGSLAWLARSGDVRFAE
jgi:hypothetical protein